MEEERKEESQDSDQNVAMALPTVGAPSMGQVHVLTALEGTLATGSEEQPQ